MKDDLYLAEVKRINDEFDTAYMAEQKTIRAAQDRFDIAIERLRLEYALNLKKIKRTST